jgi:tripartite-type tricarboxylate transporter receptor subunit TctC
VKEMLAIVRAQSGKLNYAHGGHGTVPHIKGGLVKAELKINRIAIPHKNTGLSILSITPGETPLELGGIFAVKSLADAGKRQALGGFAPIAMTRCPQWPQEGHTGHAQGHDGGRRGRRSLPDDDL